jgi:hypothetical protein
VLRRRPDPVRTRALTYRTCRLIGFEPGIRRVTHGLRSGGGSLRAGRTDMDETVKGLWGGESHRRLSARGADAAKESVRDDLISGGPPVSESRTQHPQPLHSSTRSGRGDYQQCRHPVRGGVSRRPRRTAGGSEQPNQNESSFPLRAPPFYHLGVTPRAAIPVARSRLTPSSEAPIVRCNSNTQSLVTPAIGSDHREMQGGVQTIGAQTPPAAHTRSSATKVC